MFSLASPVSDQRFIYHFAKGIIDGGNVDNILAEREKMAQNGTLGWTEELYLALKLQVETLQKNPSSPLILSNRSPLAYLDAKAKQAHDADYS
ncbi:hypothetical protein EDC56_2559 [Sinobacterium caligoides]|uniref:Uncharacterized protein n=1 Tax=Sinobacterium caligoides TaxID=933926 RepID=A0A3N2DKR1_9GAMM|nr:hypothetical protein [Sinobacterium caligoides]ROR99924.1 hypothetical protein EDC56_2559 [Sinobacterium caligoides]